MARSARIILPGYPHHIYQRGNNAQAVFMDDDDKAFYLEALGKASRQFRVDIHAYALLDDSVYMVATPSDPEGLARMVQLVGRTYVPYFNRRHGRTGTLWEGRFRTSVIETTPWLMKCCRYVEMRPVTAGLVMDPAQYHWSSCPHHVGAGHSPILCDHILYWNLGNTPFARESAYLAFMLELEAEEEAYLTRVLTKGWPLGTQNFIAQLEKQVGRPFRMGRRGRPPAQKA